MVRSTTLTFAFALIASVHLGAPPATAKEGTQTFHIVNGQRYRVRVFSNNVATVFNKAVVASSTFDEQDNRKEAARLASGCVPGEVMWGGAKMIVRLDCSSRPENYVAPANGGEAH